MGKAIEAEFARQIAEMAKLYDVQPEELGITLSYHPDEDGNHVLTASTTQYPKS